MRPGSLEEGCCCALTSTWAPPWQVGLGCPEGARVLACAPHDSAGWMSCASLCMMRIHHSPPRSPMRSWSEFHQRTSFAKIRCPPRFWVCASPSVVQTRRSCLSCFGCRRRRLPFRISSFCRCRSSPGRPFRCCDGCRGDRNRPRHPLVWIPSNFFWPPCCFCDGLLPWMPPPYPVAVRWWGWARGR